MSDLRVSYAAFDAGDDFASQQVQIASVRVRGANDKTRENEIFAERKRDITQFFQFCDNQHRLAGRAHSHFRMQRGDFEYQYTNNSGQPVIYVTPPERGPVAGADGVVLQDGPDYLLPPQCVIMFTPGGQEQLTFARSGNVVDIASTDRSVFVYFGEEVPEIVTDLTQATTIEVRGFGGDTFFIGDIALRRASASDGPIFRGWALGYMQYSDAPVFGGVEQRLASEEGRVAYPHPVPFYTVDFFVSAGGDSTYFEFRDEATVFFDYSGPRDAYPLLGEYAESISASTCGVLFFPAAARKAYDRETGEVDYYTSAMIARLDTRVRTVTNYWVKQEEEWLAPDGETYNVQWYDVFHDFDTLTSQSVETRIQLYTIGKAYTNTFLPEQFMYGDTGIPLPHPATFIPPDEAGLQWVAPPTFETFFNSWLEAGQVSAFNQDVASSLPWVDFKEREITGPSDTGYSHISVENANSRVAFASVPAAPNAQYYTVDALRFEVDFYGLEWGNPSIRDPDN